VAISTAELAVRLLVYLFVLVGVPLSFVLMFRILDYAAHDTLVEQFSGQRNARDTGQLNAYFEQAAVEATTCRFCGAANGPDYTYCHNCQERLLADD
jgi:ribosomal protein L40E